MAGLREIARACGVSTSTVSDILNRGREDKYRPETRELVRTAIRELGYQPDRTAQSMRSRRTRMIGFVAPNLSARGNLENVGVYPFLVGLSHGLTPHGYHAALVEMEEIEPGTSASNGLPPVLRERFFDALVLQYGLSEAAVRFTDNAAVPVLHWDSNAYRPDNCLRRDEEATTRVVMERLIALGHRRIAYLVGVERWERYQAGIHTDHYSFASRYETYASCLSDIGEASAPLTDYLPEKLGEQLLAVKPTALIAPEAIGARAAVDAALALGWRIPHDLTIVTLDREALVRQLGRNIGGMSYDRVAVGKKAATLLRTLLEGDGTAPSETDIFGEWSDGQTVAPPPT